MGILIGVVALGLLAAFAVGLPKLDDGPAEPAAAAELSLPDTLPGGYLAADLESSFADTQYADQAAVIAKQQAAQTDYGNQVLPEALGAPAVTRSYLGGEDQAVFVQVFSSDGGAFSPPSLSDPEASQGAGGVTMAAVGDGVCALTYAQSADGSLGDPTQVQCQVTRDGLTVQVQAGGIDAEDLVALATDVLDEVGGSEAE